MNKPHHPFHLIKIGLGTLLLSTVMGCVGYVGDGYGGDVVVGGPDVFVGGFERGPIVRGYAHRGFVSRGFAHPGGGGHGGRR
jgi:hypothetical protein